MKPKTRTQLAEENARLTDECNALRSAIFKQSHLREFSPIAWTGGSSPVKPSALSVPCVAYRRALFREQVKTFCAYWKEAPEWNTFRTFFRRAHADSFATFRGALNG